MTIYWLPVDHHTTSRHGGMPEVKQLFHKAWPTDGTPQPGMEFEAVPDFYVPISRVFWDYKGRLNVRTNVVVWQPTAQVTDAINLAVASGREAHAEPWPVDLEAVRPLFDDLARFGWSEETHSQ